MRTSFPALIWLLAACGGETAPTSPVLPGDDEVVAVVEGGPISRYDLDRTVEETLGPLGRGLDEEGRRRALESLVATRALARRAESELAEDVLLALDRKVERYRERLLTEAFVRFNAPPTEVTEDDVRAYYDTHAERYAAATVRRFEMVLSTRPLTDAERVSFAEASRRADQTADWRGWATELASSLPVAHRSGDSTDTSAYPTRLREVLRSLPLERASAPIFVDGHAFLLRVVSESASEPRALSEVRDEIRRALEVQRLRESVRAVRESTVASTDVVYR
ncbi:MAG: peptidylprolyl isomerase [Polyangiales bacterium]